MRVLTARPQQGGNAMQSAHVEHEIRVVELDTADLRTGAARLYRDVFGYRDENALSPRMLRGLLLNGGSAVGAVDDAGHLVGFSYGFPALDGSDLYHYSQATAIEDGFQGLGLGRRLKEAQAAVARAAGARTMRWAFDPANTRNAHFNLETLGARGRWFHRDFYGEPDTDRMIVEWPLLAEDRAAPALEAAREATLTEILARSPRRFERGSHDGYDWAIIPSSAPSTPGDARIARAAIRSATEQAFGRGLAAVGCRRVPETAEAIYLFAGDGR